VNRALFGLDHDCNLNSSVVSTCPIIVWIARNNANISRLVRHRWIRCWGV